MFMKLAAGLSAAIGLIAISTGSAFAGMALPPAPLGNIVADTHIFDGPVEQIHDSYRKRHRGKHWRHKRRHHQGFRHRGHRPHFKRHRGHGFRHFNYGNRHFGYGRHFNHFGYRPRFKRRHHSPNFILRLNINHGLWGKHFDDENAGYSANALENVKAGTTVHWQNRTNGGKYEITPVQTYQEQNGRYCREFTMTGWVGDNPESLYGTACRTPDGDWQVVRQQNTDTRRSGRRQQR